MHARSLRSFLLAAAALAAVGCSSIDCDDPTRYVGAELKPTLKTPEGLDAPETSDAYRIPGGGPPAGYEGGACLMKPPKLIEPAKTAEPPKPVDAPKPVEPPTQG